MRVSLIIFTIGFLTILPSIIVGKIYFDGRLTKDTYELGLAYDEHKKIVRDYGLGAAIVDSDFSGSEASVVFDITSSKPVDLSTVKCMVTRPVEAGDLSIGSPVKMADGRYKTAFKAVGKGHYLLRYTLTADGKEVAVVKSFYIN